jgi:hypothetical protein
MNHKPGLSIERHQAIGLELARIAAQLTTLSCEIGNAYPLKSRVGRLVNGPRLFQALSELRFSLEDCLYNEHPGCTLNGVYYPPSGERAMTR